MTHLHASYSCTHTQPTCSMAALQKRTLSQHTLTPQADHLDSQPGSTCPGSCCLAPPHAQTIAAQFVLTFWIRSAAASPADLTAAAAGLVSSGFMAGNSSTSCRTQQTHRHRQQHGVKGGWPEQTASGRNTAQHSAGHNTNHTSA